MAEKIVISGLGVVAPNGVGSEAFGQAIRNGVSGIRHIDRIDSSAFHTKIAGTIPDDSFESYVQNDPDLANQDRTVVLGLVAAQMACEDAWVDRSATTSLRAATLVGSAQGPTASIEKIYEDFYREKSPYVRPSLVPRSWFHSPAQAIASRYGTTGACCAITCGAASGLQALVQAWQMLTLGSAEMVIVAAVDCPVVQDHYRLWDALRVLNRDDNASPEKACRPFSSDRRGTVLSEAAVCMVLENESSASSRKANIWAQMAGGAAGTGDAGDARALRTCIDHALGAAKLKRSQVDYVQASAMGAPRGDALEAQALRDCFGEGEASPPVSSVKALTGHALGASGLLSVAAALVAIRQGFMPHTAWLEQPGDDCALNHIMKEGRPEQADFALVNTFDPEGFNSSVVLRRL